MPKSRIRKKAVYTAPPEIRPEGVKKGPSPRWLPISAVVLLILGIAWLVIYYLGQGGYPIPPLHAWNLLAGFGLLVVALGLLTRWR